MEILTSRRALMAGIDSVGISTPTFAQPQSVAGDGTWPIVSATYILIPRNGERRNLVARWIGWAFANGNDQATRLDYVPLPNTVQTKIVSYLKRQLNG